MFTLELTTREAARLLSIVRREYAVESEKAETTEWPDNKMHEETARAVAKIAAKLYAEISSRISEVQS